jgi:polyhydroxybutyrate depolymerase
MFVVAYPQAAIPAGTGFDWNVPGQPLVGGRRVPAGAADDIAFLDRAMTVLEGRYCIDPHHLDVTGISGGARTASQVGCDLGDRVAAIAPVSGLRYPDPCPGGQPMPVLAFHGTADPVDPFGGNGQAYWTYSVPEAARRWAVHNGCATKPASAAPAAAEQVVTYAGCHGGATVELTVLRGAGHTWPGGPPLPPSVQAELGPTSRAVNANEMMWTFFQAHPLP